MMGYHAAEGRSLQLDEEIGMRGERNSRIRSFTPWGKGELHRHSAVGKRAQTSTPSSAANIYTHYTAFPVWGPCRGCRGRPCWSVLMFEWYCQACMGTLGISRHTTPGLGSWTIQAMLQGLQGHMHRWQKLHSQKSKALHAVHACNVPIPCKRDSYSLLGPNPSLDLNHKRTGVRHPWPAHNDLTNILLMFSCSMVPIPGQNHAPA